VFFAHNPSIGLTFSRNLNNVFKNNLCGIKPLSHETIKSGYYTVAAIPIALYLVRLLERDGSMAHGKSKYHSSFNPSWSQVIWKISVGRIKLTVQQLYCLTNNAYGIVTREVSSSLVILHANRQLIFSKVVLFPF